MPQSRGTMRGSQSMVDLRLPAASKRQQTQMERSRESSLEKSPNRPNGFYEIRDELSKNPRRRNNKVEAYWLDEDQQKAKFDQEWWEKGNWDVVKEGGYWDNGKYIPTDIAGKVKEIVEREIKNMKGKMQRDEVTVLE